MGKKLKSRLRKSTFTLLAPKLTGCIILGKSLTLTQPWFPIYNSNDNNSGMLCHGTVNHFANISFLSQKKFFFSVRSHKKNLLEWLVAQSLESDSLSNYSRSVGICWANNEIFVQPHPMSEFQSNCVSSPNFNFHVCKIYNKNTYFSDSQSQHKWGTLVSDLVGLRQGLDK